MVPINRDEFLQYCWDLLLIVLFQPQTDKALLLYAGAALLFMSLGLAKCHGLANAGSGSFFLGIFCTVFGVFALFSVTAFLRMYLDPLITRESLKMPGLIIGVSLSFLLMIIPFTRMWFRAGYGTSATAWLLAALLGALVIFGLKQAYDPKPENPEQALKGYDSFSSRVGTELQEKIKENLEKLPDLPQLPPSQP